MLEVASAIGKVIEQAVEKAVAEKAVMGKVEKALLKKFEQLPNTASSVIKDAVVNKALSEIYEEMDLQEVGDVVDVLSKNKTENSHESDSKDIKETVGNLVKKEVYDEIGEEADLQEMGDMIAAANQLKDKVSKEFGELNTTKNPETLEKKIEKQNQEIEKVESGEKSLDSTQEKGNYGEMKTDQDLREKGYERISKDMVTDIDDSGHQGIDGVYYNPDGIPPYLIVDAKYGTAQLSETLDGKQMSDSWIDKRLDEAVGKEMADEIRMEKLLNPDNVGSYVAHVDENGNVAYDKLDDNANIIEKDVKINE